ncbi:MAG: lysophospholipid acyltransferase family protein [Chloroflexota bacterium]
MTAERGTLFYDLSGITARILIALFSKFELQGVERMPSTGPVILAANHLSIVDPVILGAVLPRPAVFMAKQELFSHPGMAWVLKSYGSFSVQRGSADREAIRKAFSVLERGRTLGLFPEGTRSRSGYLGEPHAGVGLLALRTGAPVVPIGITGSDQVSPQKILSRRPSVLVRVGAPIPSPRITGALRGAAQEHTELVMRAIAELLPEDQRGRFAAESALVDS